MSRPHVVAVATLARLGGAERSLVELVRRLAGALRFTVVVPEDGPLAGAVAAAGGACAIVPWPGAMSRLGERARRPGLRDLARAAAALGPLCARLRAELVRLAPDVVVTNGTKAHVLAALVRPGLEVPLVWCAREGLEDRPLSRLVLRALARRCDGVVAVSRYVASEFRAIVPGPAAVHVVPNIVDLRRVGPGLALPADLEKQPGEVWLGVVGALTPQKGQDLFLDAAARIAAEVPAARFLVVGGEPYRTEADLGFGATLRARAAELGITASTAFLGERDDAAAVIANLDVLVQPSRGPEGLGRTILEAMACGVPAVTVDRWGPRELVADGETGYLVPPGDVGALATRMSVLATDRALRARLGAAGRARLAATGDPDAVARAFRDALLASAGLAPARASGAKEAAAGGR